MNIFWRGQVPEVLHDMFKQQSDWNRAAGRKLELLFRLLQLGIAGHDLDPAECFCNLLALERCICQDECPDIVAEPVGV
jgi:hypothetical protein